jgi:hypothetical protein
MSPQIAIVRMKSISESVGIDRARTEGRFKRECEAWAAGMLALALTKLKDEVWWVGVETVDGTATPGCDKWMRPQSGTSSTPQYRERGLGRERGRHSDGHPEEVQARIRATTFFWPRSELRQGDQLRPCDRGDDALPRVAAPLGIDLKIRAELEKAKQQGSFIRRATRGREPGFYYAGTVFLLCPMRLTVTS